MKMKESQEYQQFLETKINNNNNSQSQFLMKHFYSTFFVLFVTISPIRHLKNFPGHNFPKHKLGRFLITRQIFTIETLRE